MAKAEWKIAIDNIEERAIKGLGYEDWYNEVQRYLYLALREAYVHGEKDATKEVLDIIRDTKKKKKERDSE